MPQTRRPPIARLAIHLCLAASGVLGGCASQPSRPQLTPASIPAVRKTIEYLASDPLEGRGVGTAGLDEAAAYIRGYFSQLGLQPPPGQADYDQPFTYTTITGLAAGSTLTGGGKQYKPGLDFTATGFSAERRFTGPVVFVGYGISGFKAGNGDIYDDYAGVDVNGKLALAFRFEPADAAGHSQLTGKDAYSGQAALDRKARVAAEHGAIALLIVQPPALHGPELLDGPVQRPGGGVSIPVMQIKQSVAEDLLRQAGAPNLRALQSSIDRSFAPRSFVLKKVRIEGDVRFERKTYDLKNVTACLPGVGSRGDRYIVVGAHYDHLGRGGPGSLAPRSQEIHPGADDNASGTAAVLELAKIFKQAGPLGRSLLFASFSGEERGLLGSQYWVEHPPVPLEKIDAMINLDMVGRLKNEDLLVGGSGTERDFDEILRAADRASPLQLKTMWKNGVAPSDNTSFVLKRIPVLFFWTGVHEDYHRPTDVASKINYDGERQIVDLVARVIVDISREGRMKFAESARPPTTAPADPSLLAGGASLGVVPSYTDDASNGVKITGTTPDSPAANAGLLPDDVLVGFGDRKIENLYDLTDALNEARAGQTVDIRILRAGKAMTLHATLAERRGRE